MIFYKVTVLKQETHGMQLRLNSLLVEIEQTNHVLAFKANEQNRHQCTLYAICYLPINQTDNGKGNPKQTDSSQSQSDEDTTSQSQCDEDTTNQSQSDKGITNQSRGENGPTNQYSCGKGTSTQSHSRKSVTNQSESSICIYI